jgi:hypothetical protein
MARFGPYRRSFKPPRPVTNVAEFIDKREASGYTENLAAKIIVLQIVISNVSTPCPYNGKGANPAKTAKS